MHYEYNRMYYGFENYHYDFQTKDLHIHRATAAVVQQGSMQSEWKKQLFILKGKMTVLKKKQYAMILLQVRVHATLRRQFQLATYQLSRWRVPARL